MDTIKSLSEYISSIETILDAWTVYTSTTKPWFRGQSDSSWDLLPKIYRNGSNFEYERELIRDFILHANHFLEKSPEHEFEWLFCMQHYGVSTRLLDWTESYLIALYFAVLDFRNQKNVAVWILNPWTLNEKTFYSWTVPTYKHPDLNEYLLGDSNDVNRIVSAKYPVALRPNRSTPRIIAQKGVFTIHGSDQSPLNTIINEINEDEVQKINLIKLEINGISKIKILRDLYISGVTHSVLFPELSGIADEVNFRYSRENIGTNGHFHNVLK